LNLSLCFHLEHDNGQFFFIIVAVSFRLNILAVSTYFDYFYSERGLIASNVLFDIIDIIALSYCATRHDLPTYFDSTEYLAFNTIEGLKNVVYFSVVFYHGVLVVLKLWNHSYEERMRGWSVSKVVYNYFDSFKKTSGSSYDDFETSSGPPKSHSVNDKDTAVFLIVVVRLTIVLALCFLCFSLRLAMEVVKIMYSRNPRGITTKSFTHNGVAWFFCSDFIPRVIPSLTFMYLMRKKNQSSSTHDAVEFQETENALHMQNLPSRSTQYSIEPDEIVYNWQTHTS